MIIRPLIDEYNYTEYYTNKLTINITPYNCIYKGDTITISVSSFQHIPIEEAGIYFDGKLINKKTSEDGILFYTVNTSGIYVVTATKNGFVNDTTSLEVKEPKAKFEFSNLLITPSKVELGKKVNISIEAINSGNAKGECEVKFVINGNIIDSKTINLDVGENTVIGFIHKENNLGKYTVKIDGETDSFKVIIPSIVYILLLIVTVISLGAYIFIYRQSDKFKYSQSDKLHNKGLALADLDRYEEALKAFEKAIKLKPDASYAWYSKGRALADLDRYEEALKAFEKTIELKPDDADAWHSKGVALADLDRHEEALKAYEKTIELKPDYYGTWFNKGLALGKLDRLEEALKAYEKTIKLKPDAAYAWYASACMHSTIGDTEKALACLRKAVDMDTSFKETAKKDKDFEKIWVDESFKKLIE
uniref:Cell division coordinator CpoB n=1 Tax=Candidatus Methanogaster sp. ANME-2c ERB4 TaxID=2759911 RepID=A0A7G9Y6M7_9EURY|nr:cell division coordinator CpoB [Methanosarcinales archaeon ANME-2c ERB4]